MPEGYTPIGFPIKGLHEGVGYDIQPPGTSSDLLNVRPFDALLSRLRGGSREGSSKFFASQINGSNPVQSITKLSAAAIPDNTLALVTDNFDAPVGTTGKANLGDNYVRGNLIASRSDSTIETYYDAANDWVEFPRKRISGTLLSFHFLAIAFNTNNDVTSTIRASGDASTSNGGDGVVDECTLSGPFIRGAGNLESGIGARFIRVGVDQVQLQIFSYSLHTITSLAVSATQTLDSSATASDDCSIRLYENGNTITAVCDWPTQSIADLEVSVITTTNATKKRAGHLITPSSNASNVDPWRRLISISFTKLVPRDWEITNSLDGTLENSIDSNRYFLPSGWQSQVVNISTNVVTTTTGPQTSASDPTWAAIDDTGDVIWSTAAAAANVYTWIEPTAGDSNAIEIRLQSNQSSGGDDGAWVGFRITDNGENGIFVTCKFPASTDRANTGCANSNAIRLLIVVGLNETIAATVTSSDIFAREGGWIRVSYDHSTHTFSFTFNGVEVMTYTMSAGQITEADLVLGDRTVVELNANNDEIELGCRAFRYVQDPEADAPEAPVGSVLAIVAGGTISTLTDGVLETPTGGDNALLSDTFRISATQIFNHVYFLDGESAKDYDRASGLVIPWVATTGTVPSTCRLLARYRGRAVTSGDANDPFNWFMSKSGDPYNWDYSPSPSNQLQAVAGNANDLGYVEDIVTCIVPFGDDNCLFGGDHSLWMMEGDPAAGGTLAMLTDKTGILFGQWSYAKDRLNTLFFAAVDGIYKLPRGANVPENMTKGRLDRRFRDLDLAANRIVLEWDYILDGLRVFIVPIDGVSASTGYFWDARTDSWWEDSYPTTYGPNTVLMLDGNNPEDQAFIMGCRDGYLRQFDQSTGGDDGSNILTRARYTPLIPQDGSSVIKLLDILPVVAKDSANLDLRVYAGQTAEELANSSSVRIKRTISAGRNPASRQRLTAYAMGFELYRNGTSRWAMESLHALFHPSGRPRKGGGAA